MKTKKKNRLAISLKEVDDWSNDALPLHPERIENYIDSGGTIAIACDEIFRTGMNEIGKSLQLTLQENHSAHKRLLASGSLKMLLSDSITIQDLKSTKRVGVDNLDGITEIMLCALATGQFCLIEPFHRVVFEGLESGYGVRDGHDLPIGTTLRYAAFGLTIIGDWLGKPLDLDKHALPRDPAWGQLVAHWREPNPEKLLSVLLTACDTHVERIALTSRELDSGNFEFGSPFEAVYPAEILAILNLRRSLGLTNPFIDHPLMKTPYAALTCPPGTRFEKDELLERFLLAARKYDPEAVPEGLYEAVLQTNSAS
ncbi:hypothetical protein NJF44_25315 [Pseudomonas guariconensis]|uniref:hypothetical protein n=1 Tax=Pseudomonas TaxID=286 RepID=UPI00209777EB|nr:MULTISPECIES: hypothetical protein [Pseudomonas]MCO7518069.1 hypothetical protein [Pseudomonas putida]MCO7608551.1 hypothetical protein [Pseudomonas guariconensis]